MNTIHKYKLLWGATGIAEIPMPRYYQVLGLSDKGFVGIIVRGDHDPERMVPKKFIVVRGDADADMTSGHRYLGDVLSSGFFEPPTLYYVFEWVEAPSR